VIIGWERKEAKRLQGVVDRAQHLGRSQHRAASGQKHQFDLRSLRENLRDRKQASGKGDYLEAGSYALASRKPKYRWSIAFKMNARHPPRRTIWGRAAHNLLQYGIGELPTEDYISVCRGVVTKFWDQPRGAGGVWPSADDSVETRACWNAVSGKWLAGDTFEKRSLSVIQQGLPGLAGTIRRIFCRQASLAKRPTIREPLLSCRVPTVLRIQPGPLHFRPGPFSAKPQP
jgi:hypothetical protein